MRYQQYEAETEPRDDAPEQRISGHRTCVRCDHTWLPGNYNPDNLDAEGKRIMRNAMLGRCPECGKWN